MSEDMKKALDRFKARIGAKTFYGAKIADLNIDGNFLIVESADRFHSYPGSAELDEEKESGLSRVWVRGDASVWTADRTETPSWSAVPRLSEASMTILEPLVDARPRGGRACMLSKGLKTKKPGLKVSALYPDSHTPIEDAIDDCIRAGCFDPRPDNSAEVIADTKPDPDMTVGEFIDLYGK